jgi:hypothetical protein
MITVPAEALFDILQNNETKFYSRDKYRNYNIKIGEENEMLEEELPDDKWGDIIYTIVITKTAFMELLINRVFICNEFELKIGL